ncbi:MAG TPA: 5'-methylthioadenosine/S-adenosylhomocysteine nucleosidase [Exilispira sp.]|nr:5'-methylthioadenosine/S-adenosylhomocysteine nucleosidase [Exilispira sp.]
MRILVILATIDEYNMLISTIKNNSFFKVTSIYTKSKDSLNDSKANDSLNRSNQQKFKSNSLSYKTRVVEEKTFFNFSEIKYNYLDKEIYIIALYSNFGMLNASCATIFGLERFYPDIVINLGAAGSLNKNFNIGDIVTPFRVFYSTYQDTASLLFDPDFIKKITSLSPDQPVESQFIQNLNRKSLGLNNIEKKLYKNILKNYPQIHKCIISTQDFNVDSNEKKKFLNRVFEADVVDWESYAIKYSSNKYKTPCLILRVITDLADENFEDDYKTNLETVLKKISEIFVNSIVSDVCKIYFSDINCSRKI